MTARKLSCVPRPTLHTTLNSSSQIVSSHPVCPTREYSLKVFPVSPCAISVALTDLVEGVFAPDLSHSPWSDGQAMGVPGRKISILSNESASVLLPTCHPRVITSCMLPRRDNGARQSILVDDSHVDDSHPVPRILDAVLCDKKPSSDADIPKDLEGKTFPGVATKAGTKSVENALIAVPRFSPAVTET